VGHRAAWLWAAGLLAGAVAGVGLGLAPATAETVRIMPLGDSLTDGSRIPGGYRIELWQRLVGQDGRRIDFVGSLRNGPASLGDRDHEGHSGWRIDEILERVDEWLPRHRPDVVLLLIGTNDMLQDHAVTEAPARLGTLIDRVTALRPTATVLVASIPPLAGAVRQQRVEAYNAAVPGVVLARGGGGRKVVFVDAARGMTAADLADGVHLNARGNAKLAEAWYRALRSVLPPR
jgi:lysophospholipase L1-like esterase